MKNRQKSMHCSSYNQINTKNCSLKSYFYGHIPLTQTEKKSLNGYLDTGGASKMVK